jgi:hypothetical protein
VKSEMNSKVKREEMIRVVKGFAGPVGPIEDIKDIDRRQEEWVAKLTTEDLDEFINLLIHPPSLVELGQISGDDFEFEISRILTMLGKNRPLEVLEYFKQVIHEPNARKTVIEVIGALEMVDGLQLLQEVIEGSSVSEEEGVRLACALGEIGGVDAATLLERLESVKTEKSLRFLEEVEIAKDAFRAKAQRH